MLGNIPLTDESSRWIGPWAHSERESRTRSPGASRTTMPRGWSLWAPDEILQAKWPVVGRCFKIANPAMVASFLRDNPDLLDVLLQACAPLRALFGESTPLDLRYQRDPEIPHRRYLCVRVTTDLPVSDAIQRMDRFDEGWWLDRIASYGRRLVFVLEFQ